MTIFRHPLVFLTSAFLTVMTPPTQATGFQWTEAADPGDRSLALGIWYPSAAPVPAGPNTPFRQALAIKAPVEGENLPVVVISHGYGGWLGGHADTAKALANAGYVVVAMTHTGNNFEDNGAPASRWMLDRPRHVARTVDFMLRDWPGRAHLDPARIGLFGFSAGGYTALVSVGGVPDIAGVPAYCKAHPAEYVCASGILGEIATAGVPAIPASAFVHEPRIRAAVIAAPGLGFGFEAEGLKHVRVPVQLWSGERDERVPTAENAALVRDALPMAPEFHEVRGAGHFAFMAPCKPELRRLEPEVWAEICTDAEGFDRAAFKQDFNAAVVAFFDRTMPEGLAVSSENR